MESVKINKSLSKKVCILLSTCHNGYIDAFYGVEELLNVNEIDSVKIFCEWLEENKHNANKKFPFVLDNYQNLYKLMYKEMKTKIKTNWE